MKKTSIMKRIKEKLMSKQIIKPNSRRPNIKKNIERYETTITS